MTNELHDLLRQRSERGDHRGADTVLARAHRELDPTVIDVVPIPRRRSAWIPALGTAVVALIAIGGVSLLTRGDDQPSTTEPPVVATTDAPASTTLVVAPASIPTMRWERFTEPGFAGDALVESILPVGNELVAVGGIYESDGVTFPKNHTAAWISPDGITWNRVGSEGFDGLETNAGRMMAVAQGPDGLVGISTSFERDGIVWLSEDGRTWERVDDDALGGQGAQSLEFLGVGPGGLVAAGHDEREVLIAVSDDGRSWTRIADDDLLLFPEWLNDFAAGDFGYVLIGQEHVSEVGRAPAMWTSRDGVTWDRIPVDTFVNGDPIYVTSALERIGITFDGSLVVWDEWGNAWLSLDGFDWDLLAPEDVPITGGIRDGDRALAIVGEGIIASPDRGLTWGPVLTGSIDTLVRFGETFVAFGEAPTSTGADTEFTHTAWIGTWED